MDEAGGGGAGERPAALGVREARRRAPETLGWWGWKPGAEQRKRRRTRRGRPAAPVSFVEVTPEPGGLALGVADEGRIELELGEVTIRVPDGFAAPTRARVLDVVRGRG